MTTQWRWNDEGPEYASPALLTVEGTKQVVTLAEKSIVSISAADGKLLWQLPVAPARRAYNAATPIVDGQTVIYTGAGRGTKAVKVEKQADAFVTKDLLLDKNGDAFFNYFLFFPQFRCFQAGQFVFERIGIKGCRRRISPHNNA